MGTLLIQVLLLLIPQRDMRRIQESYSTGTLCTTTAFVSLCQCLLYGDFYIRLMCAFTESILPKCYYIFLPYALAGIIGVLSFYTGIFDEFQCSMGAIKELTAYTYKIAPKFCARYYGRKHIMTRKRYTIDQVKEIMYMPRAAGGHLYIILVGYVYYCYGCIDDPFVPEYFVLSGKITSNEGSVNGAYLSREMVCGSCLLIHITQIYIGSCIDATHRFDGYIGGPKYRLQWRRRYFYEYYLVFVGPTGKQLYDTTLKKLCKPHATDDTGKKNEHDDLYYYHKNLKYHYDDCHHLKVNGAIIRKYGNFVRFDEYIQAFNFPNVHIYEK